MVKAARERHIRHRRKKENDSLFVARNNANQKTEEQHLRSSERKKCQVGILHTVKVSLKNPKDFIDIQKLKKKVINSSCAT